MLQGANQKALLMYDILIPCNIITNYQFHADQWGVFFLFRYSNVDMKSQEAYEMAARGLLGPEGKSPPILKGLRCIHFQPPNFTLGEQFSVDPQGNLSSYFHADVLVCFFLRHRGAVSERHSEIFAQNCAWDRTGAAQHCDVQRGSTDQRWPLHLERCPDPSTVDCFWCDAGGQSVPCL